MNPRQADNVAGALAAYSDVPYFTFTLVACVKGKTLSEARAYLTGALEVGDGEGRIVFLETHDEDLTS